jgi:hypothetical protein
VKLLLCPSLDRDQTQESVLLASTSGNCFVFKLGKEKRGFACSRSAKHRVAFKSGGVR